MPAFPIIDCHVHIWKPGSLDYPWLAGEESLNRAFLPEEYREACGAVEVEAMVFIEADADPRHASAEVQWVVSQARRDPRFKAIVAFAPLEDGDRVREHLERLAAIDLVKGVRRIYQHEADTDFCLRDDFVAGVRAAGEAGLSFDMCITHRHLESSVELARRCPDTAIVLDHIGKPDIANGQREPWRRDMFALAACGNVACKLSGVATEADPAKWTAAQLRFYIDTALEAFGPRRVMFGSDWPVATKAVGYPEWVAIVDDALRHFTVEEQRCFFVENARAFYRLA